MLTMAISIAKLKERKIGICGQAPSDYPEFAEFLVRQGIDSISLNPDTVLKTRLKIAEVEAKLSLPNSSLEYSQPTEREENV
jgi:pyruvate, water dikinase